MDKKRRQTKHTSTGIDNNKEAIEAHKKRMEAKGWRLARTWQYEGVTRCVNLDYEK